MNTTEPIAHRDAELALVHCALFFAPECLPEIMVRLPQPAASPRDALVPDPEIQPFTDTMLGLLYDVMASLYRNGITVDPVSVREELRARHAGRDDEPWLSTLAEVSSHFAHPSLLQHYLDLVISAWQMRRLVTLANCLRTAAPQVGPGGRADFFRQAERVFLNVISQPGARKSPAMTARELAAVLIENEGHACKPGDRSALPCGLPELERLLFVQPGHTGLIAARPSIGKSALACQVAVESSKRGWPVVFFSLEMTAPSLAQRMVANLCGVNPAGPMQNGDLERLSDGFAAFSQLPLRVQELHGATLADLRAVAKRLHAVEPFRLAMVDYLQLLRGNGRYQNRESEVADISRGLKALAGELGCTLIMCSQLNRDPERGGKPRLPRLSDLRESGSLEQDAHFVILLHVEDEADAYSVETPMLLLLEKNREFRTGVCRVMFKKPLCRFVSRSEEPLVA